MVANQYWEDQLGEMTLALHLTLRLDESQVKSHSGLGIWYLPFEPCDNSS
jgi:hypothetical protein